MAVPTSDFEAIVADEKTWLEGITVANGYFVAVNTVEREVQNFDNVRGKYPYIGIAECVQAEVEELPSDVTHVRVQQQIVTYITQAASGDVAAPADGNKVLNAWLEAIRHRLNGRRTFGGFAIDARVATWQTNQGQHFDDGSWVRAASLDVYIEYEDTRSDQGA